MAEATLSGFSSFSNAHLTADSVRCAFDDKVNILVETMRQCSLSVNNLVDLARNPVGSVQHGVRAAAESTIKTSDLAGAVEKCTEAVNNVRALCEYISNSSLATCFRPGQLGTNQHVFACRHFSVKMRRAPKDFNHAWHYYPVVCSQGKVIVGGYRVELSPGIFLYRNKNKGIAFKLTFVAEAQTAKQPIEMTLVLVHPTQPSRNKIRPLKSSELYVTSDYVGGFRFSENFLREEGFVADDMLLLCIEVIE